MQFERKNLHNLAFFSCCQLISEQLKGGLSELFPAVVIFIYYNIKNIFSRVICISELSQYTGNSKCCVAVISLPPFWFCKSNFSGELEILVVHASLRSLGYGSEMMNYAIKFLKENIPDCTLLKLKTNNSVRNKAISFYEKHGFKIFPKHTKEKNNSKLLMTRSLL